MKNDQNDDVFHLHPAQIQKLLVPPIVENTELKRQLASRLAHSKTPCSVISLNVKFQNLQNLPTRRAESTESTLL